MNFPSRVKNDKRWGLSKLKNTNIQEIIKGRRTYGGATEKKKNRQERAFSWISRIQYSVVNRLKCN